MNRIFEQRKIRKWYTAVIDNRTVQRDFRKNSTRVLLEAYTGRSHQLRLHMWQLGHPILGDEFYFNHISRTKSTRLMPHATSIEFIHPVSGENVFVESRPEF